MNIKVVCVIVVLFVVIAGFVVLPKAYYSEQHPILEEIHRRFTIISPKYANIPLRSGRKSYTEDKSVITLCLIDPQSNQYYDINVLMYVACHELAHVVTKAAGKRSHGEEFKSNFSELLRDAAKKGVYDPSQPIPLNYCGSAEH